MKNKSKAYIGTSGYSYPHWKKVFYPEGLKQSEWFDYYLKNFDTVELNVTFYRLPKEDVFFNWYKKAPKSFRFAVKGSRYITHIKRIQNIEAPLKLFKSRVEKLKEKLGVVLWQLPPRMKKDIKRLEIFCKLLKNSKINTRHAFEFRDESWLSDDVYDLLKSYNFAFVISHSPGFPYAEKVTADFIYIRFHGGELLYGSNYSKKELENWALKIKKWQKKDLDIYAYFNNDAYGYAVKNAKALKDQTN